MDHITNDKIISTMLGDNYFWFNFESGDIYGTERLGKEYVSMKIISEILYIFEKQKWEDLPGQLIRVNKKSDDPSDLVHSIGHILKDKWFCLEDEKNYTFAPDKETHWWDEL